MKDKLGFTLIELLAVIVILAIIALIASPIIVGLIEDSKRSATERSADSYTSGIEIAVANKKLIREDIPDVAYTVMANGNLCSGTVTGETCTGTMLDIKMDGSKPTSGIVNLDTNGNVATATLCINDAKVIYTDGVAKHKASSCTDMTYSENILNGTDPVLGTNMIPVRILDDGTVKYADIKDGWYDYSNQEWANAVMLSSGTYSVGDTIPESAIRSYFVWIPRYRYKIFNTGNYNSAISSTPTGSDAQEIEVVFEAKDVTASNGSTVDSWLTHPAFISFDVNGLWVGKFETGYDGAINTAGAQVTSSDSSKIIIKPDVYSWRYNTVYNIFVSSYNYSTANKSHMMKNIEWGMVAYLSHSKYGINKEININNNFSFKTGYSAVVGTDQSKFPGTYGTDTTKTIGYVARTGKNLFNTSDKVLTYSGVTATVVNNAIIFNGISTGNTGIRYIAQGLNLPISNYNVTLFGTEGAPVTYEIRDKDEVIIAWGSNTGNRVFTITNKSINAITYYVSGADNAFNNYKLDIQIEEGTIATSYEKYGVMPETEYYSTTTGNITGIYDMSGGAWEYMSSYKSGQLGSSGFNTTTIAAYDSKYFDVYSVNSDIVTYNYRILGDATGEIGPFYYYADGDGSNRDHNGWYKDYAHFVSSSRPWYLRGGDYTSGILAGQFNFYNQTGAVNTYIGSRLVLATN